MTEQEHIAAIAEAFNAFMRQLELGDHRDSEGHQVLRNQSLSVLRDAIAHAAPAVDVVSMDDARALARRIIEEREARKK